MRTIKVTLNDRDEDKQRFPFMLDIVSGARDMHMRLTIEEFAILEQSISEARREILANAMQEAKS